MRPTRYKSSIFDTSVILLQSRQARRQKLDEELLEERIRSAFLSRHQEELERRKEQSESRNDDDSSSDSSGNDS